MFLTKEKFLAHFPAKRISRKQFIKQFKIMYSKPLTLENAFKLSPIRMKHRGKWIMRKPIMTGKDDLRYVRRQEVIDYFYQVIITHRHFYLGRFYDSYFGFKDPDKMRWDSDVDIWLKFNEDEVKEVQKALGKKKTSTIKVEDLDDLDDADREDFLNNLEHKTGLTRNKIIGLIGELEKRQSRFYGGNLSLQKNDASRVMVRNLFYLELLDKTRVTNTIKNRVSFWESLVNLYNKLELEDRFFAKSSIKLLLSNPKSSGKVPKNLPSAPKGFKGFNPKIDQTMFYLFQAYQPKASIINPYSIHWWLENLFDQAGSRKTGKKLFTPVLSWGSYLIGMMETDGWDHYVGTDVMPSVCQKVDFLGKWYQQRDVGQGKTVELYCQPSEQLALDKGFLKTHKNDFDLILVCPPYYDMEIYHEGPQSIASYPNYDDWLEGYWRPTIKMCHKVLNKQGYFGLIVNNYYTLAGDYYPLVDDMTRIVRQEGFRCHQFYYLYNRTSPLRVNVKDRTERLMIFKK